MRTLVDLYLQSLDVIGDAIIKTNNNIQATNAALLKQGEDFFKESIGESYQNSFKDYEHILNKLKEVSFPAEIKNEHFNLINAYGAWVNSIASTSSSVYQRSMDQYFKSLEQQASAEKETLKAAIELRSKLSKLFNPEPNSEEKK